MLRVLPDVKREREEDEESNDKDGEGKDVNGRDRWIVVLIRRPELLLTEVLVPALVLVILFVLVER